MRGGPDGSFAVFARTELTPGDRIVASEQVAPRIVSLATVQRDWPAADKARFDRDAWPITKDIWVTWSRDPEDWVTPRHSCDPNAWFDGLDITARRAVTPGEEVTLDYATFRTERMPAFQCSCGALACRGTITGEDHLTEDLDTYGVHVSEFVRRRRTGQTPPVHATALPD